jgi:hypothetical protein
VVVRLRLTNTDFTGKNAFAGFNKTFALRQREADEFYATIISQDLSTDAQNVMRQGFAGMLWSKQFYQLRNQGLAGGRSRQSSPASGAQGRTQPRVDSPL